MRLIDADKLNLLLGISEKDIYAKWMLDKMPTIEAEVVVRCRECKHHREKNKQEKQYLVEDILICTSPDVTDDCWSAVWPDHFCAYGERKEGAE